MSKSKSQLAADASKLRVKIAEAEATLQGLRNRLAKIEAQESGEPAPQTGLDMLWKAALPISRTRSSQLLCRKAWNMIPASHRPKIADAVAALVAWNSCDEWKKDGGQYAIALDRWIKERRWENLPETKAERDGLARYRVAPKPIPAPRPEDAVTDRESIAELLSLSPKRMNS
jgi:hypothetical protein